MISQGPSQRKPFSLSSRNAIEAPSGARLLLSWASKGEKTKDAKSFLLEILADGQKSCNEIMDAAKEKGIKKKTLWNAKKELNIDSVKVGSQWYWML